MSAPFKLIARIVPTGVFKVGANPQPANQFQLVIKNQGDPVQDVGAKRNLYLDGALGSGADALFLNAVDARNCDRGSSKGWQLEWDFSGKDQGKFRLKISTFNLLLFDRDQELTIKLSKVISNTAPGTALLSFETEFETDLADGRQDLTIEKSLDHADILSFYSDPPAGVQNLPGSDVVLKWRTYRVNSLQLTQDGGAPLVCDFSGGDEGSQTIPAVAANMQFQLSGSNGSVPVTRALNVVVLAEGWYDLRKNVLLEGDPGYPAARNEAEAQVLDANDQPVKPQIELEPTLLLNANDQSLYGVFRHDFQWRERTLLFETKNPFAGWRLVASTVPGEEGYVPEGFGSSPGVYFDDAIWLIGGSQIDPDNTSNGVFCFAPSQAGAVSWENRGPAPWTRRMGHAVVVFDQKIWVLGGRDDAGNALNDVWTLGSNREWKEAPKASWPARCLLAAAVFHDRIWIYGGVDEPFSDDLYDDFWTCDANFQWEQKAITGIIGEDKESRRPIAAGLQVFKSQLHLFGTFRTINSSDKSELVEQMAFVLSTPSAASWTKFPTDKLQHWGDDKSFSYQLVNFKDKMLVAKALAYDKPNPVMKVYVPA